MCGSNKNEQFDPEVIHWHLKVVPIPANHFSQTANGLVLCIVRARLAGDKCISIKVSSPNVAQTDPMTIALVETWLELWVPNAAKIWSTKVFQSIPIIDFQRSTILGHVMQHFFAIGCHMQGPTCGEIS